MIVRSYEPEDVPMMRLIWNEIVDEGRSFPQYTGFADAKEAAAFFQSQTYVGVAGDDGKIEGFYILHPNNVGRCGHIANASYCVRKDLRGQHIGVKLVMDSLRKAQDFGFYIMQFNAVVDSNVHALNLYKRLGFTDMGVIPNGFVNRDEEFEDIHVMYLNLFD